MRMKRMNMILSVVFCICLIACAPGGSADEGLTENNKEKSQVADKTNAQKDNPSDMDCDEETLQKLQTYLESFFETVKYGGFDQGHTDIVWYWAAQTLFQQGKALEEDGAYAVSMEDAKQWIKQNVIMPEGTEVRLSEGMPKADAKYPIAYDEGKLLFYCQQIKDTVSFKIQMVKRNNFTYSLAGEVTRSSEREESKESFRAQIDEDGAGVYRLTRLNTESFSSRFVETKYAPKSKEYQERANEIWKRVSEGFGQKDMEGGNISGEELAGMKDALSLFFGTPMLGSFTQESMSSAVTFSVQKMLRSDMGLLTYHKSVDYYTISVDDLAKWMSEKFVVPGDYDLQIKKSQNENSLVRIEGDKVVFRYCEPSESEPFCIDWGMEDNGSCLIYGHNPLAIERNEEKQGGSVYPILGADYPYREFAAVFEKTAEGKILLKEFYLRFK